MSTRAALARHNTSRLDAAGWALLGLVLLIVGLSIAQSLYRMTLPSEGWSFTRDLSGAGPRLVVDHNVAGSSSPLRAGDVLLAVDGQPIDRILAHAITLQSLRPERWAA